MEKIDGVGNIKKNLFLKNVWGFNSFKALYSEPRNYPNRLYKLYCGSVFGLFFTLMALLMFIILCFLIVLVHTFEIFRDCSVKDFKKFVYDFIKIVKSSIFS